MRKRTKVKNLPSLKRKLYAIPRETAAEAEAILDDASAQHVAMSKARIHVRSGTGQRSIRRYRGVPAGSTIPKTAVAFTVIAGERDAFYLRWLEHGNSQQPAYPFFYPPARIIMKVTLGKLEKAAETGARRAIGNG